jgi:hypothetical protein
MFLSVQDESLLFKNNDLDFNLTENTKERNEELEF